MSPDRNNHNSQNAVAAASGLSVRAASQVPAAEGRLSGRFFPKVAPVIHFPLHLCILKGTINILELDFNDRGLLKKGSSCFEGSVEPASQTPVAETENLTRNLLSM